MIDAAAEKDKLLSVLKAHLNIAGAFADVLKVGYGLPPSISESITGLVQLIDVELGNKPAMLALPAPGANKMRSKEPIIHEIEGTDVEVTPLQSAILDQLGAAEDALHAGDLARAIGNCTPAGITFAIKDLRERMAKAGCKCELNGYRGRGFRLEIDRGEE